MGTGTVATMSATQWRDIIEGRTKSDLTTEEYCRQLGVTQKAFYRWRRRIQGPKRSAPKNELKQGLFHEVALTAPPVSPVWAVELVLSSGVTIRVRG